MDRELTPDDITELLPAYALDAVDDDERAAIEAYLGAHPDERDAVDDLRVAASMLAHTGGPPPEGVWERLESIIASDASSGPPPLRLVTPRTVPDPHGTAARTVRDDRRWRWLAVAAAVVALVFGGLWLADRGDGGGAPADTAAVARTAATAPGARHATLTDTDGNTLATAVVTRDGTGYLTSQLPAAPVGKTYQLWAISRRGTISLGVLGRDPGTVAFTSAVPTTSLAITTEVAGGVPVSRNAPDAVGDIA
jgi:anti-sigma-K factor RskA